MDWEAWQQRWDRQQQGHIPDREERFAYMVALATAVSGTERPLVLDLACGPGSITRRVLDRHPEARVVAVDVDPVLLAIAQGVFAGDDRVTLVEADLRDPGWAGRLPVAGFDAVLTATALHWLPPGDLERLYRDLAGIIRPGGAFCNSDGAPLGAGAPRLAAAARRLREERARAAASAGADDWEGWWAAVAEEPALQAALAERRRRFEATHPAEFAPPAGWHLERLRAAGFAEAEVVWRAGEGAIVAAVR